MNIPDVILTPLDFSESTKAGKRRFWKQILPVTSIDYNGTKIDFDDNFHKDLKLSFAQGAYDQVPIVFADSENRHNMDPRNFGGDLLDVQYRGTGKKGGTWGLIEADPDTAKVLEKNPKLGVSARILQNIRKADGRTFKRAINHVLLTMNPRVSGMEPWQAVDLSEAADIEVVDLTAARYTTEGTAMPKTTKRRASDKDQIDLSTLSDDDFQRLLDLAVEEGIVEDPEADEEEEEVEEEPTAKKPRKRKSKTKITVEEDEENSDGDEDEEDEEEDESTDLSEKVIKRGEVSQFQQMRYDLAEERWDRSRAEYEAAGVPPFLLDLAEPVLALPDAMTIDLSEDETLDASDTIRKMLDGVKGILDFSEIGHQHEIDLAEADDTTTRLLTEWDENYG